ncbi:MAG: cysteine desulfurase [Oscillospiraceae bacterium]|jgi:cysteine desulfurase|nr:cysteine desulfurase [Oscillospiraceae bacterium]
MIYLDNAATTRPCGAAIAAITSTLTQDWGNPSSVHHFGVEAARLLARSRESVAQSIGAQPQTVYFTSGATESNNWVIYAAAERLGKRGKHIITTAVEHHAVLHPIKKLESAGFSVSYLQPDGLGRVSLADLEAALRPDTILVSIMAVNNESGAVMPIEAMAKLTHRTSPFALFHTDAVQALFKQPLRAKALGVDALSISGHKVHAGKGVGALYLRDGLHLPALLRGGGQESNLRGGTENLPMIAGFAAACEAQKKTHKDDIAAMRALQASCRAQLEQIPGLTLLGAQDAPHIVTFALEGLRTQGIINALQERGIYVSAGSACSRGHRSHVLTAMQIPPAQIDGAVRASFSRETTQADIDALAQALPEVIENLG